VALLLIQSIFNEIDVNDKLEGSFMIMGKLNKSFKSTLDSSFLVTIVVKRLLDIISLKILCICFTDIFLFSFTNDIRSIIFHFSVLNSSKFDSDIGVGVLSSCGILKIFFIFYIIS
jgi:hypothetical protein